MEQLIPVEGEPDLARDPRSGAILSVNQNKYNEAVEKKRLLERVATLEDMVAQQGKEIFQLTARLDMLSKMIHSKE